MANTLAEYFLEMLDAGDLPETLRDNSDLDHLPERERLGALKRRRYYRSIDGPPVERRNKRTSRIARR